MSALRIRDLHVRFGANPVIAGLDLDIADGEFLVLLGPSGCGKSTLLHAIAGLTDVAAGRVEIGGRDMTAADPAERGIGMVFQNYALYPTMTVERNLSFGLRVAGLPRAEIDRRVQRVAAMLQLQPLLQRKPAQLSGGQRQRVAIGRALVREAGIYLLDEPLSNLDAQLRSELRRELKLLHRQLGATMVHVTHDQVEAMTLATRIVVMRGGTIQQVGTPAEVYARPANRFVAGFLGAPGMNFIDGTLRWRDGAPVFDAPDFAVALPPRVLSSLVPEGQAVTLGIRPEHVSIGSAGVWAAQLHVLEPMGNHQVAWLVHGHRVLSALMPEGWISSDDAALSFDIDRSRLSLFDTSTGVRL